MTSPLTPSGLEKLKKLEEKALKGLIEAGIADEETLADLDALVGAIKSDGVVSDDPEPC